MLKLNRKKKNSLGQTIIEFTFSMIIVFLMLYALTKIFEWTGQEFSDQRLEHDTLLNDSSEPGFTRSYNDPSESIQIRQVSPFFATTTDMNAIWNN